MRITGGNVRGRILKSPRGMGIRPTTDRVREAVFSIIGQDLSNFRVLDLFAGTGCLGLEALSRNAEYAVFIDISQQALKIIQENLALCGCQNKGDLVRRDLKKGLPLGNESLRLPFDLVFLDPPYGRGLLSGLMEEISATRLLSKQGLVVAELSKAEMLSDSIGTLQKTDIRTYGDTQINFFSNEVSP